MAEPNTQTTIIGPDTHIKGDMSFDSTARILGTFEGSIHAKGELQIASGATCKASVDATKVVVDGEVDGNLNARERIEMTGKARVKGDVVTARLVVAEGAAFIGHCTVGPDAVKGGAGGGGGGASHMAEPKVATGQAVKIPQPAR